MLGRPCCGLEATRKEVLPLKKNVLIVYHSIIIRFYRDWFTLERVYRQVGEGTEEEDDLKDIQDIF